MSLSPNWHDTVKKLAQLGTYVTVSTTGGHKFYGIFTDVTNVGKYGLVKIECTRSGSRGVEEVTTHLIAEREIVSISEISEALVE